MDPEAIVYYRYERMLEDLGEMGRSVFGDEITSETSRASEVDIAEGIFTPGGMLETVEQVDVRRSSGPSI